MRLLDLFGPILSWEMLIVVRRRRYFVLRGLYVLILLLMMWTAYQAAFRFGAGFLSGSVIRQFSLFASSFFYEFSITQLSAVLFLTPAYVASAIVVEKERKTIEYLFASSLTNREIVLGKWGARAANVFMLILGGVPILAFASFFGGVDLYRVLLLFLLTTVTLASTASIAILASIYRKTIRLALGAAYGWIILLLISPWFSTIGASITRELAVYFEIPSPDELILVRFFNLLTSILTVCNPYVALLAVAGGAFSTPGFLIFDETTSILAVFITLHLVVTGICLSLGIWRLRESYRRQVGAGTVAVRKRLPIWSKRRKIPPVGDRPMLWKEWYFSSTRALGIFQWLMIVLAMAAIYWPFLAVFVDQFLLDGNMQLAYDGQFLNGYTRSIWTIFSAIVLVVTAVRAATCVSVERDKDSWLTLMSTCLTGREIIGAKWLATLRPALWLCMATVPIFFLGLPRGVLSVAAPLVMFLVLGVYASFVASLGVYHSLRRKNTGTALTATLGICVAIGGFAHMFAGLFFIPLALMGVASQDIYTFFMSSIPWIHLWGAPFQPSDLRILSDGDSMEFFVGSFFWLTCYVVAGLVMLGSSMHNFDQWVGRSDRTD